MSFLDRALRMGEAKKFKSYEQRVAQINAYEPEMESSTDEELRELADELRQRAGNGESLDALLPEWTALYEASGSRNPFADPRWLTWAEELADDVLERRIADECGVRWSHTEHRLPQPQLEPSVGWMQGAAGIAGWLLRLARVERDGTSAARTRWPDHPGLWPAVSGL